MREGLEDRGMKLSSAFLSSAFTLSKPYPLNTTTRSERPRPRKLPTTQFPGRKAVKEKREQTVVVTVLEVICAQQQQQHPTEQAHGGTQAAVPIAATPAAAPPAEAAAAASHQPPPRKRQRTMEDFALAAAARKQQQGSQGPEGARGGDGAGAGGDDMAAVLARVPRRYLLVERPQVWMGAGPGGRMWMGARGGWVHFQNLRAHRAHGLCAKPASRTTAIPISL